MSILEKSTGQLVDNVSTGGFLLGCAGGWEDAAKFVKELSGKAFMEDKDDDARLLKKIATQLLEKAQSTRKRHDAYKEANAKPAWGELERRVEDWQRGAWENALAAPEPLEGNA